MMIGKTATNDPIHRYHRCLVVPFEGNRKVMSTSMHNGGYRQDLTAVFNQDVNPGPGRLCDFMLPNQEEKKKLFIEKDLGLDYDHVAAMATIVSMDNASIQTDTYDILTVTAIATASLEVNGGRVGETATSYEKKGESISLKPGTINIMVFVNADMSPGCMARAMMTATEAKTAAIQELMGASLRSHGIATGSGTDNLMIIADAESDNHLTYAGKHGKLGELIGRTVMSAVKESLGCHMGLTVQNQHRMLARMKRYEVDEYTFTKKFNELCLDEINISDLIHYLHMIDGCDDLVTLTSLFVHLMDQYEWKLISDKEAVNTGAKVLRQICDLFGTEQMMSEYQSGKDPVLYMTDEFVTALCKCVFSINQNNIIKESI